MSISAMTIERIPWIPFNSLPPGAKCITRNTRWSNPYKIVEHGGPYSREEAIDLFRAYVEAMTPEDRDKGLKPLRSATALACCPLGVPCHADVLIEYYNCNRLVASFRRKPQADH
jgi:hypothetical protein